MMGHGDHYGHNRKGRHLGNCGTKPPLGFALSFLFLSLPMAMIIDFREGEGGERERKRNIDMREKHPLVASCTHPDWGPNLQPRDVP